MKDLIERLEKATGPDRELDDAIRVACGFPPKPWNYTASLDAALTLVPARAQWTLEQDAAWVRMLSDDDVDEFQGHLFGREGNCTAIALCIAALKARMASHQSAGQSSEAVSPVGADGPQ